MNDGWDRALFKRRYVAAGGSANSANAYVSYLGRAERVLGGLSDATAVRDGDGLIGRAEQLPVSAWGHARDRRDSLSALRCFVRLSASSEPHAATTDDDTDRLIVLLAQAQRLGAEYYALTGKPLGVTGEVAELEAARNVGVELCAARTPGYDGWIDRGGRRLRAQVKARAVPREDRYRGRCPSIKVGGDFDVALLVLMDRATLAAMEIWEADREAVTARLSVPGSKARSERGSLAISQFVSIATMIWSDRSA